MHFNKILIFIIVTLFGNIFQCYGTLQVQNIDVGNYTLEQISTIPLNITNQDLEIDLQNAASAEIIKLEIQNIENFAVNDLTIKCVSYCPISLEGKLENLKIKNLHLFNAYLVEEPNISLENITLNNTEATYTAIPEIKNKATINIDPSEDMRSAQQLITGINIVPASGEFVYDTEIIYDTKTKEALNHHSDSNLSDAIYNLNQLSLHCPNLKWASPVLAWFGISTDGSNILDIEKLNIVPGVDSNTITTSTPWQVGKYNRNNAYLISKNEHGNANYGGTVNDQSIIKYVDELKSRGLKIMFYPMIFMDLPHKPWRGNIFSKSYSETQHFFNKKNGYNEFILHYANLLKGRVDAFVIGSEMQELTQSIDSHYEYPNPKRYPAVFELTLLAEKVKKILGPNVKVTYAANWSEYHHDKNGVHHLDYLWASKFIDIVGIDAYLPITNKSMGDISVEDIKEGWQSGELWNYYYNQNNKAIITPEWGLKQIEYWWKNEHLSNNLKTDWRPKMKPIWFTEFGFPSMHMASNTPHVYWSPNSKTENIPKKSSGRPDFAIQSRAIRGTLEYWKQKPEILENMLLWAWDARPFPYFPRRTDIWSDGEMWSRGHLINGKISPMKHVRIKSKSRINCIETNADSLVLEKNISTTCIKAKEITKLKE